jgi:hypothetical protein
MSQLTTPRVSGAACLHPFEYRDDPIDWGRGIDAEQKGQSGTNAYVFEVKIRSRVYALKIVSKLQSFGSWDQTDICS